MRSLSFNGLNLQADPFRTVDLGELMGSPTRNIIAEELARSDNAVAVFRKYMSRSYTISGNLRDATSDLVDAAIDQIKYRMLHQIGDMALGWAGGTRYYRSECKNVNIARSATDLTRAGWSAEFFMPIAFATDGTTATLASSTAVTAASQTLATNNIGTYLALPIIEITFTAVSPTVSPIEIVIGNPESSEYLTITDTFANGDTLTIDLEQNQIFHNSELINPAGDFPAWAPGSGLLDYSDNASSRTMDINATYSPRYL